MVSLFTLDTDGLQNNPNLKFDPQNAAGHLNDSHQSFQQLKEGLTPEQIEILENVTQVDGFELDDADDIDETMELVDPETGEVIDISDGDYTLDELGFIDPTSLKTLVMEAFYSFKLEDAQAAINQRYNELHAKQQSLMHRGHVGRLEANNINELLVGGLYDNIIMESFTKEPTKVNFNLVMEEMDAGKAALAAGGAVIGVTLLYKLVKWFMNVWNKNGAANQSISDNVKTITERGARLASANDVIINAQKATAELQKLVSKESGSKVNASEVNSLLASLKGQSAEENKGLSKNLGLAISWYIFQVQFGGTFNTFWHSWLSGTAIGGISVNKAYGDATKSACDSASALISMSVARLDKIRTTAANEAIPDSNDTEYNQHISTIDAWVKLNGFASGIALNNIQETTSNFANHVLEKVVKPVQIPDKLDISKANYQVFDGETFGSINEDLNKTVGEFMENLEKTGGTEEKKYSIMGKGFGGGTGNVDGGSVNKGDNVQKDTRIREYNKSAEIFRGAMNIMRSLHAVRNTIGKGLNAVKDSLEMVEAK